jgi:uncharacterized protein YjbI with pentapeptide repeats
VHTLAQARTSTVILRLDAEHNENVTRFLINSGLAASSETSPRLLSEIVLSQATLSDAYLDQADLSDAYLSKADLSGVKRITNEELEQQAYSLKGATMPNGQKYEDWIKSKDQEENKKSDGSS